MKIQLLKNHDNKQPGWVCEVIDRVALDLISKGIAQEVPKGTPSRKDVALYDNGCNPSPKAMTKAKKTKTETEVEPVIHKQK